MIKLREGLDYSESNYNDFLSDNFVGFEPADTGFDGLMKQIGKVARALHTRAEKLYFVTLYEDVYLEDLYVKELFDGYYLCHKDVDFVYDSRSNVLIFKNEMEMGATIPALAQYGETYEESYGRFAEGLVDISDDFRMARSEWNRLHLPISFDDALEQWNEQSDLAEPTHWYAKPVYSQKAWADMVDMFSAQPQEPQGEDSFAESLKEDAPRVSKEQRKQIYDGIQKRFVDKVRYALVNDVQFGFPENEVDDYFAVEVSTYEMGQDGWWIQIEIRAEVDYDGLEKLITYVDPIVRNIDRQSYFEPVTSGIIEAIVEFPMYMVR